MRPVLVLALVLLLAGCASDQAELQQAATDAAATAALLDAYVACPVVDGETIPCEATGDNPSYLEVEADPPLGWRCLSFSDQRLAGLGGGAYPFPDWYAYAGPDLGDGAPTGDFLVGLRYDAHGDTPTVLGAAQVLSEDATQTYIWEGPSAGFVRLPVPIRDPQVYVEAVFYPVHGTTNGQFHHEAAPDARNDAAGPESDVLWSRGTWRPPAHQTSIGEGTPWQWNAVQVVENDGRRLHALSATDAPLGHGDPRPYQGESHWGQARFGAYNATLPGLFNASLVPYMETYYTTKNVHNAVAVAAIDALCRCPGLTPVTPEGVLCAVGVPTVAVEDGVVRAATLPASSGPAFAARGRPSSESEPVQLT